MPTILSIDTSGFDQPVIRLVASIGLLAAFVAGAWGGSVAVWKQLTKEQRERVDEIAGSLTCGYLGVADQVRDEESLLTLGPLTFSRDVWLGILNPISNYARTVPFVWIALFFVGLDVQYRTGLTETSWLPAAAALLASPIFLLQSDLSPNAVLRRLPWWIRVQVACSAVCLGWWLVRTYPLLGPGLASRFVTAGTLAVILSLLHPALWGCVNRGGRLIGGPGILIFAIGLLAAASISQPVSVLVRSLFVVTTAWTVRVALRDARALA